MGFLIPLFLRRQQKTTHSHLNSSLKYYRRIEDILGRRSERFDPNGALFYKPGKTKRAIIWLESAFSMLNERGAYSSPMTRSDENHDLNGALVTSWVIKTFGNSIKKTPPFCKYWLFFGNWETFIWKRIDTPFNSNSDGRLIDYEEIIDHRLFKYLEII